MTFVDMDAADQFQYTTVEARHASRREATLVAEFVASLSRPMDFDRQLVRMTGGEYLVTDHFDNKSYTLYKAKSQVDRATVRLALGQILDYTHWFAKDGFRVDRKMLLVPEALGPDLVELLASHGIGLVYPSGDLWVEEAPAPLPTRIAKSPSKPR